MLVPRFNSFSAANSHLKTSPTTLSAALLYAMMATSAAQALQPITEQELSDATGEGLGIIAEDFSFVMADDAFVNIQSAGGGAPRGDANKADIYLYGVSLGGSVNGQTNRAVTQVDLGTDTNPAILTTEVKNNVPLFEPNTLGDQEVMSFKLSKRNESNPSENLKLALWADILARDTVNFTDNPSNRLTLQVVADKFSLSGSRIEIAKTPSYPDLDYTGVLTSLDLNGSTNLGFRANDGDTIVDGGIIGERTYTPNLADNNTRTISTSRSPNDLLAGTGVSIEYLLPEGSLAGNGANVDRNYDLRDNSNSRGQNRYSYIGDRHWGPVFNDNHSITAARNRRNRFHNRFRQAVIERYSQMYLNELNRMASAYSDKVGITGMIRLNSADTGGMRISTAASSLPTLAPTNVSAGQAGYGLVTSTGTPGFDTTEGWYLQNLDINLPLGQAGYQPILIYADGENGNELTLEVARIPNNPLAYNKFYIDYSNAADVTAKTCTSTSCPDTATHGSVSFQSYTIDKNGNKNYGVGRNIDINSSANFEGFMAGISPLPSTSPGTPPAGFSYENGATLDVANFAPLTNGGYNQVEGIMIQHLKLTTNALSQ